MGQFFKKLIISTIIVAILFAPFSSGLKKKEALAAGFNGSSLVWRDSKQTSATFLVNIQGDANAWNKVNNVEKSNTTSGSFTMTPNSIILVVRSNSLASYVTHVDISIQNMSYAWISGTTGPQISNQNISIEGLKADNNYIAAIYYRVKKNTLTSQRLGELDGQYQILGNPITFSTANTGSEEKSNPEYGKLDLGCNDFTSISLETCVAQLSYLVFYVSSEIAKLAGHFLDFFVYYSTNSSSYSNEFIKQGWAAVRDVANMFFILILLFIAVKTILGLNVSDNKRLVGMVIMVALIINFSLFTTKVVIDASNILAKVFYNNISSVKQGTDTIAIGKNGEKSLSVGLVDKFNPQELVSQPIYDTNHGTFILLTLLLAVIVLYTAYIFFSVALLFVGRVVSLWLAMIFSPIAFLSYATPFDVPAFGKKEWWDDLFKNSFMAPAFIFFLYIIILFAGFLTDVISYTDSTDLTSKANIMQHLMKVVVPFVIIFMLLNKAKGLAEKMSGEMGKFISGAGKAVGAMALGGAALTGAWAGRTVIARGVAKASRDKKAIAYGQALHDWDSKGRTGPKPTTKNLFTYIGGKVNAAQMKVGAVEHGRHELDEIKKKAGLENVPDNFLSGAQKTTIEKLFTKENRGTIESEIRRGYDAKGEPIKDHHGHQIPSENTYKANNREHFIEEVHREANSEDLDQSTRDGLSDLGRKKAEDKLNAEFNKLLSEWTSQIAKEKYTHLQDESKQKIGLTGKMVSSSTSGSYDIRKAFTGKLDKREGSLSKLTFGIIAAVALGMRQGVKNLAGVESYGTPQGNFFKDIGNVVTEALKNVNVKVDLGGSGGGGGHGGATSHAGHGGGGHGGGGASHGGGGHGGGHH